MKKIISILLFICLIMSITACSKNGSSQAEIPNAPAPKIVIKEKDYYATELTIVNELPEGYEYMGELSEGELKYAHIDGNKYYVNKSREALYDFYVYQECGTPIDDETVDSTKRQWAYVKWSIEE